MAESRNQIIEQIENQITDICKKQKKADDRVQNRIRGVRWIPWVIICVFIVSIGCSTYYYGWEKMEFLTWLIAAIIASFPYLMFAIGAKSFNPQNIIDIKYKNWYKKKMYKKYDVNLEKKEALEKQKKEVEEAIS